MPALIESLEQRQQSAGSHHGRADFTWANTAGCRRRSRNWPRYRREMEAAFARWAELEDEA